MRILIQDIITGRRSIRRYLSEDIPMDLVNRVLDAACWAPSAHNAQPWRFIVVTKPEVKRELAEEMAEAWAKDLRSDGVPDDMREDMTRSSIERFTAAPVVVIICLTMEDMDIYRDERRREVERVMAVQSVAAAVQNLLLAAYAEGLGACWYCAPLFCPEVVRDVLEIPADVEPQALLTIGRPAEAPGAQDRLPLRYVVHYERWQIKRGEQEVLRP